MIKTVRYKVVNGKRIFVSYDSLYVDPVATEKAAMQAVDKTAVKVAMQALRDADPSKISALDFELLANKLRRELWLFKKATREYALKNPIHFQPRDNERIICPLLAQIGQGNNTNSND